MLSYSGDLEILRLQPRRCFPAAAQVVRGGKKKALENERRNFYIILSLKGKR